METFAAFGDSVLKGVLYEGGHYRVMKKSSFCRICESQLAIRVDNKAKFGIIISKGREIFDRNTEAVKASTGKYVIFEFGGNDCAFNWPEVSADPDASHIPMTTISDFTDIYSYLIDETISLGKTPLLLSLPPIDGVKYFDHISRGLYADNILRWMKGDKNFSTNWHERYNLEVFKLAKKRGVPVIDITSPFLEEKDYTRFLCEDGIHPNKEGHKLIANAIVNEVESFVNN